MATLPLLLFPSPASVKRTELPPVNPPRPATPDVARQGERIEPKFAALSAAFDSDRIQAQRAVYGEDPDLVLVLETVGAVDDFINAANRTPGVEWLFAGVSDEIQPSPDFFYRDDEERPLNGKLFLLSSTRRALEEIESLWKTYKKDQKANLGTKLNAWKAVFPLLHDLRFWGPQDRLSEDVRALWEHRLEQGSAAIRFEIEAWYFRAEDKNRAVAYEVEQTLAHLGGRIVSRSFLPEIQYHGFLAELGAEGMRELLGPDTSPLLLCERVMLFKPQGQAVFAAQGAEAPLSGPDIEAGAVAGLPVAAVLDGMPVANHPRLAGRLIVDDPLGWDENYPAGDRQHGTAVSSLVAWGELHAEAQPLGRPIYVRPIMRPDFGVNQTPHPECTPDDVLLVDLIHSAVRRIFEGDGDQPAQAPTVRIVNISVGDDLRPFDGYSLSPWARLLDWLSHRFNCLFIVSAGNRLDELVLEAPRDSLHALAEDEQQALAMKALLQVDMHRRLFAPAESINALTVGASHADRALTAAIPGRPLLFGNGGVSPFSCIGPGFRRSIKPDVLFPGGRIRYWERFGPDATRSTLRGLPNATGAPGLLAACPPAPGGADVAHVRGTSYAAALATRAGVRSYEVLESIRATHGDKLPPEYDAVLIKALLVHGSAWGSSFDQVVAARPDLANFHRRQRLAARYLGYGASDIEHSLTCTEQRATLLGVGSLRNEKAAEFRVPVPMALHALPRARRLTVTLAWMSPVNPRHSRYRVARLWVDPPASVLALTRKEADYRQVRGGTVQHEILEGAEAVGLVEGQELVFTVNCLADASRIDEPIRFALCATLEVAEELGLPIYQQIAEKIAPTPRIGLRTA